MTVLVFCMCLLGSVAFSASEQSSAENDWEDRQDPSDLDFRMASYKTSLGYKLPLYITEDDAAAVAKQKTWFHYNNPGPLPEGAKAVMLPTTTVAPVTTRGPLPIVEARCHMDRIYVRILKSAVNDSNARNHLYFGNCRVNAERGRHYYFLYPINRCLLKPQVKDDSIVFANSVRYLPKPTDLNDIIRTPSLTVPVTCKYPRYHRTYDVGIHPKLGSNLTQILPAEGAASILVLDANWTPLAPGAHFVLGQAMHFEIRGGGGQRVFPDKCWFTASDGQNAELSYTVIMNHGCMVDSRNSSLSRFYIHNDPAVLRFTIEAFVFPNMNTERGLSLHCEVSVGGTVALHRKACDYNQQSGMWKELDQRFNLLCLCCNDVCPEPPSFAPTTKISSVPWKIEDAEMKPDQDEEIEAEDFDLGEWAPDP